MLIKTFIIFFLLSNGVQAIKILLCNETVEQIQICELENPTAIDKYHYKVMTNIEIIDINTIDSIEKTITLVLHFMIEWYDTRYYINGPEDNNTEDISYDVPIDLYNVIDSPKLTFLKAFSLEKLPLFGNGPYKHFWCHKDWEGFVRFEYAEHLHLKMGCDFEFKSFPFDEHLCELKYYSPSNSNSDLILDVPVLYDSKTKMKIEPNESMDFKSKRTPFEIRVSSILDEDQTLSSFGYEYSVAGISLKLRRSEKKLLVSGFYVPTGLFGAFSVAILVIRTEQVLYRDCSLE